MTTDGQYIVTATDMGCDCCSYVTVAAYNTETEIPERFRAAGYDIEFEPTNA